MPATVPVDDPIVQFELTRYMEDHWVPVIEKDVDGSNSLPLALDRENPNLGRYSACRRVARTIYMGSAPTQRAANRGIDDRQVKLGCVQPGETVATFGDAIRRLTDRATYLYVDGKRYWYSTQPTVTRLADDRASQLTDDDVEQRDLRTAARGGEHAGRFREGPCLSRGQRHPRRARSQAGDSGAGVSSLCPGRQQRRAEGRAAILESRGNSPRNYRNTLVFLAADANRLRELDKAVRQYLAWLSIWDDRVTLNLDQFQTQQAETKRKISRRDGRCPDPRNLSVADCSRVSPIRRGSRSGPSIGCRVQDPLATRAAKKLKNEELLMCRLGEPAAA